MTEIFAKHIERFFLKRWNYENWPYTGPVYYKIWKDMAEKLCVITISMDKWINLHLTFLKHWKGDFCQTYWEIFKKNVKLWKLAIFWVLLLPDSEGYGRTIVCHHFKHGPMEISLYKIFHFWHIVTHTFAKLVKRFSKIVKLSKLTIL